MSRTVVALWIHDTLLKVALHFSSERFRDVTYREKTVTIDSGRAQESSALNSGPASSLADFDLDLQILVFVF